MAMSESQQLKGEFGFALEKLVENETKATDILIEESDPKINGFSDFYSDDVDEDGSGFDGNVSFENDFDAMEQREQERTENMLLETEFKLFHEEHDYQALKVAEERKNLKQSSEENGFDRERFRYYSMGYSANVDQVDDLEIARWQSRFPYFHIVGFGEEPREESKPSYGQSADQHIDEHGEEIVSDSGEFMIVGRKLTIHSPTITSESIRKEYEGEIFEIDGIEEEIIAIHYDPEFIEKSNNRIIVEVEPT